ncbi:MFS family permease [Sphingomonas vulcanisoli]|uniref:MFS family permease n=1 Tax=Sphingomonas vulcanisoli TaxID=1658060 RepID=A0ABX0TSU0_9SPHN|nr:MFS transporter [Sphingomonas vulcanisoli]NIJ07320.1 MFS family permease [Sphingomonas vulcanisoli]
MVAEGDSADNGSPRHWLLVVALLVLYAYAFIDRIVLALLVDPIKHSLGTTDVQMGLLLGLGFSFFFSISVIPAGHFVDRYNRRAVIGVASVFWATMTIVCGTSTSLGQLFVGRAGVGIAEAFVLPASFSLIRDAVPMRSRGLAFSLYAMAPLIGGASSLLIGGRILAVATAGAFHSLPFVGGLAPWQATLVMIGGFGLPLSLLLLMAPEPLRPPIEADGQPGASGMFDGFVTVLRHMRVRWAVYVPLILYVTFGAMMNFSKSGWEPAVIGRTWHIPPQQVGPMLGLIALPTGLAGLVVSGLVLNRLTVRGDDVLIYGLIAAIGTGLGLFGTGFAPSLPFAIVMIGIDSFFLGTSYSVGAAILSQITPVRLMGRATAVYFLFQSLLGASLGPYLIALGSQKVFPGPAGLGTSFGIFCGLFGAAMAVAVVVLRRQLRAIRV